MGAMTVCVKTKDGLAAVGFAVQEGDKLILTLGQLETGAPARAVPGAPPTPPGAMPTTFPNYGRSKGAPIAGATRDDLDYYAAGAKRSIADPAKERWHAKERALLAAIEAEVARQGGESRAPRPSFMDAPAQPSMFRDDPPPPGDDDIPF